MLSETLKKTLISNWGAKAESLACYAEVKFIDSLGDFACYVLAMNPDDEDEIACIIHDGDVMCVSCSLMTLLAQFDSNGESIQKDPEFRKIWASELFKKLNGGL